jgi:hypothetical protein
MKFKNLERVADPNRQDLHDRYDRVSKKVTQVKVKGKLQEIGHERFIRQ